MSVVHSPSTYLCAQTQVSAHLLVVVQVVADGHFRESTPASGPTTLGFETDPTALKFVITPAWKVVVAVIMICRCGMTK